MPGIKTAISLDENLFHQVNQLASDMQVSRSRLFTLAVRDFLKKHETRKMLAQLNAAYDDDPNEEEKTVSDAMRKKHRNSMGQESW